MSHSRLPLPDDRIVRASCEPPSKGLIVIECGPVNPFRLVRPQDLLALELDVSNLRVTADGRRLERIDPARPGLLIFRFPAQHVAERAFFQFAANPEPADLPPVGSIAA